MDRSIREWLRDIHADLEVYAAEFKELGYNPQFLMETESEELEQDLKDLVKKVHLRVILKEHAKLKKLDAAPADASRTSIPATQLTRPVESSVLEMIPCAKDVMAFQPDRRSIGSGHRVLIPIWRLRSIQGRVHSEMTFTSGSHKDASVYELIHDMLSGRQRPEDVKPLQVVVDDHRLHIVRGHRRGLALCALQGIWRDRTVLAPCCLYNPQDPEVANQFAKKDTMRGGLAVQLHGKCPEAWHMGKPLFRAPEEWCDSTGLRTSRLPIEDRDREVPSSSACTPNLENLEKSEPLKAKTPVLSHPEVKKDLQDAVVDDCRDSKVVCCFWLRGKCWCDWHHVSDNKFHLHEDVPGLQCGFGASCKYKHYEARHVSIDARPKLKAAGQDPTALANKAEPSTSENNEARTGSCAGSDLKEGMVVCVKGTGSKVMSGKIVEISRFQGVKVRYSAEGQEGRHRVDWFPLHCVQVPDFSNFKQGMHANVKDTTAGKVFQITVLRVSDDKDRSRAPVYVHYNGYDSDYDEWVGADRLRSKVLKFHEPCLPFEELGCASMAGLQCGSGFGSSRKYKDHAARTAGPKLQWKPVGQDLKVVAKPTEPVSSEKDETRQSSLDSGAPLSCFAMEQSCPVLAVV